LLKPRHRFHFGLATGIGCPQLQENLACLRSQEGQEPSRKPSDNGIRFVVASKCVRLTNGDYRRIVAQHKGKHVFRFPKEQTSVSFQVATRLRPRNARGAPSRSRNHASIQARRQRFRTVALWTVASPKHQGRDGKRYEASSTPLCQQDSADGRLDPPWCNFEPTSVATMGSPSLGARHGNRVDHLGHGGFVAAPRARAARQNPIVSFVGIPVAIPIINGTRTQTQQVFRPRTRHPLTPIPLWRIP
jgi:hypothetical protein